MDKASNWSRIGQAAGVTECTGVKCQMPRLFEWAGNIWVVFLEIRCPFTSAVVIICVWSPIATAVSSLTVGCPTPGHVVSVPVIKDDSASLVALRIQTHSFCSLVGWVKSEHHFLWCLVRDNWFIEHDSKVLYSQLPSSSSNNNYCNN